MKKYQLVPVDNIPNIDNIKKDDLLKYPNKLTYYDKKISYNDKYKKNCDIVIINNDVINSLENIPDETATLIVSSPPYNLGKPYEKRVEFKEYLIWQKKVAKELNRILHVNGSLCWQVGNYVEDGEVFPLDIYFYEIFKELDFKLRNRIIWKFGHGLHTQKRFSGRYETLLWFTKNDSYIFNLDPVRIPQKYPGKTAFQGPNRGKLSGNPLGKNPSDIWDTLEQKYPEETWRIEREDNDESPHFELFHHNKPIEEVKPKLKALFQEEWRTGIWDIPNVKSNHPEKTIHTSQFPIELIERLVLALTNKGDVVLDPFSGVGSALVAATLQQRRTIGSDYERPYTDVAFERCLMAINGTIKKRELGKPVYKPKGKIAKTPEDFEKKRRENQ